MLNLALAVTIGWAVVSTYDTLAGPTQISTLPQPAGLAKDPAGAVTVAMFDAPALPAFDEMSDRPLFGESRSRVEVTAPTASVVRQRPMPSIELAGVVITTDVRQAFVRHGGGEMLVLRIGDQIDGWRLTDVSPGKAVFQSGARHEAVLMGSDVEDAGNTEPSGASEPVTSQAPIGTLIPVEWD